MGVMINDNIFFLTHLVKVKSICAQYCIKRWSKTTLRQSWSLPPMAHRILVVLCCCQKEKWEIGPHKMHTLDSELWTPETYKMYQFLDPENYRIFQFLGP